MSPAEGAGPSYGLRSSWVLACFLVLHPRLVGYALKSITEYTVSRRKDWVVSARYPPRRAAEVRRPRDVVAFRMRLVSLLVLLACLLGSASAQATSKSAKPRGKLVGKSPSSSIVGKVNLRPAFLATAAKRAAAQPVAQPCSCGWRC